ACSHGEVSDAERIKARPHKGDISTAFKFVLELFEAKTRCPFFSDLVYECTFRADGESLPLYYTVLMIGAGLLFSTSLVEQRRCVCVVATYVSCCQVLRAGGETVEVSNGVEKDGEYRLGASVIRRCPSLRVGCTVLGGKARVQRSNLSG
ncbi:unnamed protein product, partial [Scytosiphon promiscuus]